MEKTNYYIVEREDGKKAVFNNGQQVSDWYDTIIPAGIIEGKSNYFIAGVRFEEGDLIDYKYALFDREGHQVSYWYYSIRGGLVDGECDYYIATIDDNGRFLDAVYDKKDQPVSPFYEEIINDSLFRDPDTGSCYYAFKEEGKFYIARIGSGKRVGAFEDIEANPTKRTYRVKTEKGYRTIKLQNLRKYFA
jgi:hypothetical protein